MIRATVSDGACRLYMLLDDMARDRGNWSIKQAAMAVQIGCNDREIRNRIHELEKARHLTSVRTGRSSIYTLSWVESGTGVPIRAEQACLSERHGCADRILIEEPGTESRDIINADDEEIEAVLGWLRDYPGALSTIGTLPPRAVAIQCIEAAGGDLPTLAALLSHLAKRQQAKPGYSWGWFPAVIRNHFEEERMRA